MRKKTVMSKIWTGSIIAALAVSVGIFAAMLQFEKKVLGEYERGRIYTAAREIPEGQVISEENCEIYLTLQELDKNCIPETALQDSAEISGLVADRRIEEGVLLTTGMFERQNEITAHMRQPVIAGFKADDLYQVAGGVLRAGDRIHIYTVSETGEAGLVWENIYVEEVFDSGGKVIESGNQDTAAQRVNIYLDKPDVERFYTELARGTLRVVKVCEQ